MRTLKIGVRLAALVMTFALTFGMACNAMASEKKTKVKKKIELESFGQLTVKANRFDVIVKHSDNGKYYLSYNKVLGDDEVKVSYSIADNALIIKQTGGNDKVELSKAKTKSMYDEIKNLQNTIIVYIPEGKRICNGEISMENGDFESKSVVFKNTQINLSNGDIHIDKGALNNTSLLSYEGDIDVKKSSMSNDITVTTKNGDVTMDLKDKTLKTLDCKIQYKDGDVELPDGWKKKVKKKDGWKVIKRSADDSDSNLTVQNRHGDITF
ncbi:Putative adhesin [Lachnospiraceae bacterium KH1T2]|nr:Putative adhesin [Lachnospiraceae bacterium KH1T2]